MNQEERANILAEAGNPGKKTVLSLPVPTFSAPPVMFLLVPNSNSCG